MEEILNESNVNEVEQRIKEIVADEYEEYELSFKDVQKQEGLRRGVMMKKPGAHVSPTVYIPEDNLDDIEGTARALVNLLVSSQQDDSKLDMSFVRDYDKVKPKLSFKMVNSARNVDYLVDKVYKDTEYENLVLVPIIEVDLPDGGGAIVVKKEFLDIWNTDAETVITDAKLNAPVINPMEEMNMAGFLPFEAPFRVFSIKGWSTGARILLYPKFFKMLDEDYPEGAYIIPSSIHEIIVVRPQAGFGNEDENERVKALIKAVNSTEVSAADYLSDNLYGYKDGRVMSY